MFGIVLAISYLPNILINTFAGVYVDRADKKKVLVISELLSGVLIFLLFILYSYQPENVIVLVLYSVLISALQAFFSLAMNASFPNLVSKERLNAINSSNQGISALLSIFGPVVGALAYTGIGFQNIFILDGISYLVSGILIIFLRFSNTRDRSEDKDKPYIESLKEIGAYIKNRSAIKYLLFIFLMTNFVVSPSISLLLPFIVYQKFDMSATQLSLIEAALAVGFIVGAILVSMKKVNAFVINKIFLMIQMQGLLILLWVFPELNMIDTTMKGVLMAGYMGLLFFTGVFLAMGNIPMTSYAQMYIPEKIRGSFFGVMGTVVMIAIPIGTWLYGILLDQISFTYVVIFSCVVLVVVGAFAHRSRDLREFFNRDSEPEADQPVVVTEKSM
ncbi:MFS-type transporter involved in bile tolerance, Atg22 family [Paenibacillus sp. cl6col]|nr:MFS-type transporter involved in bile tolerance, Atg22 family [Paenibacillus sp. cl6col]